MVSAQERIARMEEQLKASGIIYPSVSVLVTSRGWVGYVEGRRVSGEGEYFGSLTDALDAAQELVNRMDSAKLAQTLGIEVAA